MGLNVGRWARYLQAKVDDVVSSGHAELDELEAERAERTAAEPWLADDAVVPDFDETKARIEARAEVEPEPAGAQQARLDLDRRNQESAERLAAIRAELGVDPPTSDGLDQ